MAPLIRDYQSYEPMAETYRDREGSGKVASKTMSDALRLALDEAWAWPRPGAVASEGTAWSDWDDEHYDLDDPDRYSDFYRKSTPASRKHFVTAAHLHIQERVEV